jgi:hypothetical protein
MPLPTSHFYITPDDEPDPAITLPLSAAIKLSKLFLAYGIFLCLFARRASLSAAIALYLIALSLLCGIEVFGPFGADATAVDTATTLPTTTTAILDSQPMTASTHALDNAVQVLEFAFLTFVVLGLLVRYASIGALVGLSLIVGGFLHDFGIGLHGVDAATTTTVLESAGECAASGQTRSTGFWVLSTALAVLVVALVTGHLQRCMPESNNTTTFRSTRHTTRTKLACTLLVVTSLAVLIPMAFAADPTSNPEMMKRSPAAAAQGDDDVSPIWVTYYSTTMTWLPAVTVTAPPIPGSSPMPTPTKSTDFTVTETDWVGSSPISGISGHICTELEQAVYPIVEGRKTAAAG